MGIGHGYTVFRTLLVETRYCHRGARFSHSPGDCCGILVSVTVINH